MAGIQTFLQVMAQRKTMTETEAMDYLESIGEYIAPGLPQDSEHIIKQINKRLKRMHLEIRGYLVRGQKVFALINLVSDEVAKNEGSQRSDVLIDAFKDILALLAQSKEYKAGVDELEVYKGKLTTARFCEYLDSLCNDHWLTRDEDDENLITYGPRSYLELSENLRAAGVNVPQIIHT